MQEDLTRIGGFAGATIAFTVTVLAMAAAVIGSGRGPASSDFFGLACISLIPTSLGYFAGKEGARSKTVPGAFVKGAVFFGCATGVCGVIGYALLRNESVDRFRTLAAVVVLASLVTCTASLVSGAAAVYVRDYRQIKRFRLFPQFTLQELMIVMTLVGVISSAIASAAFVKS